ncbi:hypothetical protein HanXRQr2_Chr01g0026941 [Helianthus annuus]|uniref:Uncharacterized protein n=1 Tax=Helianthus annuus TaxID=4232 RepID=A0A9K3JWI3_HELAN|nr:hypothetical protein HanXRQr2_Chr01g0026941 [Helianthus annuus]
MQLIMQPWWSGHQDVHLVARSESIFFSMCASWSSRRPLTSPFSHKIKVGTPFSLNVESTLHGCSGFLHVGLSPT